MEQRNGDITYGQFAQLYRSLMFSAQKTVRAQFSRAKKEEAETVFVTGHPLLIAFLSLPPSANGSRFLPLGQGVNQSLLSPQCNPNAHASFFADGCPVPR